jgi:hypothetical protein
VSATKEKRPPGRPDGRISKRLGGRVIPPFYTKASACKAFSPDKPSRVVVRPAAKWPPVQLIPRGTVFRMPSFKVEDNCTDAMLRAAAPAWQAIKPLLLGGKKMDHKERICARLFHALMLAYIYGCSVRYSLSNKQKDIFKQVVAAFEQFGMALEHRSLPGGHHQTRLLPLPEVLERYMILAPPIEPTTDTPLPYVAMRSRRTDDAEPVPIPYDPSDPTAIRVNEALEKINAVNRRCNITYRPKGYYTDDPLPFRPVATDMAAIFTDNFEQNGRYYSRTEVGIQELESEERATVLFDGRPGVELDYSGHHIRLAYHLLGMECPMDDPHDVFETGDPDHPSRHLVKQMSSTIINADDEDAAIKAFNWACNTKTKTGEYKRRKALKRARKLLDAKREAKLTPEAVLAKIVEVHAPIAEFFNSDAGLTTLMPLDAKILLAVLLHFADRNIPALGVHDSVIVPAVHEARLHRVMREEYHKIMGFYPVVH